MVTRNDMHPGAYGHRYLAETRGSQDRSSMSVHSTGYERHGGCKEVVYEPTSAQAQGSQAPSSMSVHRVGCEDAGHGPPSTQAQGKSGNGNGYDHGAAIHKPSPTEVTEHQSPVSLTRYGTGIDRCSGYKDPVHKPPPNEVAGNQSHVSSTGYKTGYDHHSSYKDPVEKAPPTEVAGNQSHISSTGYDHHSSYNDPVQKPPPTEVTGKQSHVSSTGYDTGNDCRSGYEDPIQKPPSTENAGNQSYSTSYDPCSGYKDPIPVQKPTPTEVTGSQTRVPGSVGGSGYPANEQSSTEAPRKGSEPSVALSPAPLRARKPDPDRCCDCCSS